MHKQIMIASPPQCLALHMQRSVYLPSGHITKNNCRVIFKEYLDITPFCKEFEQIHTPDKKLDVNFFIYIIFV